MDQKSIEDGGWECKQQAFCVSSQGKGMEISCEHMEFKCVAYMSDQFFNFLCYGFTQVKSVLDPCEDENEGSQDNEVSLGAESLQRDEHSDSDTEVNR